MYILSCAMFPKKCFFFLGFLSCFVAITYGQSNAIDSLKNELLSHKENDTLRVHVLNTLALHYIEQDIDSVLTYVDESQSISKTINFKNGIAKGIYLRGLSEMKQSNFDAAIEYFTASAKIYEQQGDSPNLAECYAQLGHCSAKKYDFENAITYFNEAVKFDKESNNVKSAAIHLKHLGYVYFDLGEYDEALIYFDEALAINLKNEYRLEASSCYNIIGGLYSKRDNYPTALEFLNKSLTISENINDTIGISKVLNNIAIVYKRHGKFDEALVNYKKSLAVQKQIGNQEYIAVCLNNIGSIYLKKEEYDTALRYYNDALLINRELNRKINITRNLTNIGNTYLTINKYKLAEQYYSEANVISLDIGYQIGVCNTYRGLGASLMLQKKYDKALEYALKGNDLAKNLKVLSYEMDISHLLADIYKNNGDYKNALLHHEAYKKFSDSIFNDKNTQKLAQLEAEYKYQRQLDSANIRELKLKQTVTTTSQNLEKTQRNLLIGIIVFLGVSLLLGAIIFYLKLRNAREKNQNVLMEQKLLRSQMTPHFIFNSLSVLQGMILNKEREKSVSYLSTFSKLLRTILENSRYKTVPLSDELTAIESYMGLQNMDASIPFNFELSVSPKIDINATKIPPMVIQPFVENAIEHAFKEHTYPKSISVKLTFKEEDLICTIIDNGVGISDKNQTKDTAKKSLATAITSERLKMLSKEFQSNGSLEIKNRKEVGEKGTKVTLMIPYKIKAAS